MKLLIFHTTVAPYRLNFFNDLFRKFGAEIYLYYRNLKSQKFDYSKIEDRFEFTPHYMERGKSFLGRDTYKGHVKAIKDHKPDVVLVNEYKVGAWVAILYRFFCRKKYKVVTMCDDSLMVAKKCRGIRRISRDLMVRFLDGIVLCDKAAQEWYGERFPELRSVFFPIVCDDDEFRNRLNAALPLSNRLVKDYDLIGKKVFLYVGRISPVKNLLYLADNMIRAMKADDSIRFVMVGDVTTDKDEADDSVIIKESILKKINEAAVEDRFILTGRKEGEELLAWYNVGQVFVLTSVSEAFGAVVNEALLAGEYAMVSKYAGSACMINGINGEIIDIDRERFDVERVALEIRGIESIGSIRENLMPRRYYDFFEDLTGFLESMKKSGE